MRNSSAPFKALFLLALPLLLLLGLHGREVTVLRVAAPGQAEARATPRATLVKQLVSFEAAAPRGFYLAPPVALGWGPALLPEPAFALPQVAGRRWAQVLLVNAPRVFAAAHCRQRLLAAALAPQAP